MIEIKNIMTMSNNKKYIFEGIPHKLYEGEMSDLGYKSGEEVIEYAMKLFDE